VAEDSAGLFCPLEYRYGRAEFRHLFSRGERLKRALQVEAALAAVQGDLAIIPADAARDIAAAASGARVSLDRVDAIEKETRHDVMAIVRALSEQSGKGGAWVHFGATSNDITDTALGLEHQAALRQIRDDLTSLVRVLVELAKKHRSTAEVSRTHGQHAVPQSFGYKIAVAAAEVRRHRDRLDQLLPRVAVGKMSGAVGTGAGFGPKAAEIELRVMERLGLGVDEAPSQIVGRDRIAEMTNFLALTASTAERLATEVRNLQRSEIREVFEAFDEATQVGSSTMAQKRNPVQSENVASLARVVRSFALPPLENMVQWHERDLTNSANERIVLPHALLLTDDLLTKLTDVFAHLHVDVGAMRANLDMNQGNALTESLMLALTAKGLPRSEAHELLRQLTRESPGAPAFRDRVKHDPTVRRHLTEEQVEEYLDPQRYIEAAAHKTDLVIAHVSRQL
jgi:adenylosuccinate lyase